MGRLLDLANRLAGAAVPPVPSLKFQSEPLQPAPVLEVPPVPSPPQKNIKSRSQRNPSRTTVQRRGHPN